MKNLSIVYGGRKGKRFKLGEANDLIAVRTHSRESVADARFSNSASQEARGLSLRFSLPHAGVEVFEVSSKAKRDSLRRSLSAEKEVRFAGRVLTLEGGLPALYSENLYIKYDGRMAASEVRKRIEATGLKVKKELPYSENGFFVEAPEGTGGKVLFNEIPVEVLKDAKAQFCQPELIFERSHKTAAPAQWHLKAATINGSYINQHSNVESAWAISSGEGTVIAVIDDGVDQDHEEFSSSGKIVHPRDVTLGLSSAYPQSDHSDYGDHHGTACAGVACGDGYYEASGVAPRAKLMPIRLRSGLGSEEEAEAFFHAAENGADIISCSWGPRDGRWWDPSDPTHNTYVPMADMTREAIDYAIQEGRNGSGCVITWAAGNGNESVENDGYASYSKVIAVGACSDEGTKSVYSDFGRSLHCCFPSNNFADTTRTPGIWTADRSGAVGYDPGAYTDTFGGTSSSCPGVAGTAGLILAANPSLRWDEVKEILGETADQIDTINGDYDSNGHSDEYGFGRVNASRAVAKAISMGGAPVPLTERGSPVEGISKKESPGSGVDCRGEDVLEGIESLLDHFHLQNEILLASMRGSGSIEDALRLSETGAAGKSEV